jgi:hypothetical protein
LEEKHNTVLVLIFECEDGGCMFLWNVCILLQDYMASCPRRQYSPVSHSLVTFVPDTLYTFVNMNFIYQVVTDILG